MVPRIRSKSMFGGVGVYSGERFFALIDNDDTLFFKVDDATRPSTSLRRACARGRRSTTGGK